MDKHVQELLIGAIDLHIHCDPSFMFRRGDALSFSNDAAEAGMRAICVKDHHFSTVQSAFFANSYRKHTTKPFDCFASICLNHSSGDFNPYVLETHLRFGAKQVYFPTISSRTPVVPPKTAGNANAGAFIPTKKSPPMEYPLQVFDEAGKLKKDVLTCIELIRDYNAILGTGHLDYEETYAVVKAAVDMGCKKILLTHFDTVGLLYDGDRLRGFEELKEIQALGDRFVEYTNTMAMQPLSTDEYQMSACRFFGPERICLGTDAGSRNFPSLIDLEELQISRLITYGFTDAEIRLMTGLNQRELLDLLD